VQEEGSTAVSRRMSKVNDFVKIFHISIPGQIYKNVLFAETKKPRKDERKRYVTFKFSRMDLNLTQFSKVKNLFCRMSRSFDARGNTKEKNLEVHAKSKKNAHVQKS